MIPVLPWLTNSSNNNNYKNKTLHQPLQCKLLSRWHLILAHFHNLIDPYVAGPRLEKISHEIVLQDITLAIYIAREISYKIML